MTNIIGMIEKYWGASEGRKRDAHYPSGVTNCIRKEVWSWRDEPKSNPIEDGDWWALKIGDAIHGMAQSVMVAIGASPEMIERLAWKGYNVDVETRSGDVPHESLKSPIRYRLDILMVDDDQELAVVEFKTAYGRAIPDIKAKGPKDSALMQAIMYLVLLDIKRAYIPYVSRDNGDRVQFVIERVPQGFILSRMYPSGDKAEMRRISPAVFDRAIERLKAVEEYRDSGKTPERPFIMAIKNGELRPDGFQKGGVKYKGDWQCSYCQYMNTCWDPVAVHYQNDDNSEAIAERKAENDSD